MQRISLKLTAIFVALALLISCGVNKHGKLPSRIVPIAINIKSDDNSRLGLINTDYYRFQLLDDLRDFQKVDLKLVDADEKPEVVLDLTIDNFIIWPKDERTSRRTLRRNVQVGTDAAGKPVYQTVTASVDITQTQIRSNARFITRLTFIGKTPPDVFERNFSPNYTYSNVTTSNIQGDSRAIDPGLYSAGAFNMEPRDEDFLLVLSKQELIRRISDEIRRRYQ
ncbi:MAG TPA: hypothetical protein VNI52_05230 [Sphingobacteriaceae bacterium]|nr:hypothetical protein [Sphingobacteriaceae bacterium]